MEPLVYCGMRFVYCARLPWCTRIETRTEPNGSTKKFARTKILNENFSARVITNLEARFVSSVEQVTATAAVQTATGEMANRVRVTWM